VVLWTSFSKCYDFKKHLMRKKKYGGAEDFPERGSSVLRFIKMLGRGLHSSTFQLNLSRV